MLDYSTIYTFSDPLSKKVFRGGLADKHNNIELYRGEVDFGEKVVARHLSGMSNPGNIIWTYSVSPLIISELIVNLFMDNGITGWDTFDVDLLNMKGESIQSRYYGLVIKGRVGYADYSRSRILNKNVGIGPTKHVVGRYFSDDYYDGSDLFMENPDPDGKITAFRYCTEKVYSVLKKHKITNLRFEKANEIAILFSSIEIGASPFVANQIKDLQSNETS